LYSVRRSLPGNGTESNAEHRSMIRSLVLLWGFPNQLSSDSWAVGFEEADPCSALDCETTNGSGSKIFCPGEKVMWAAMQQTTGCSLMRFFTDIERESPGVICPRVSATGRSCTSASAPAEQARHEFCTNARLWLAVEPLNRRPLS